MTLEVRRWLDAVSGEGWHWYVKYLSGNDTLLNESHQAGPYIAKGAILELFPSLERAAEENPRVALPALVDSHGTEAGLSIIWYNNKLRGGTRNECRITGWGGRESPILDPDATGSLCIFAFHQPAHADSELCRVWLCSSVEEEDAAQDRVGPVEPGAGFLYDSSGHSAPPIEAAPVDSSCRLRPEDIPASWRYAFPEASAVVDFSIERLPTARRQPPDQRLVRRRDCEFEIFRSVEDVVVFPRIQEGFGTVDLFVDFANSVTNRRKSRSGASLELHAKRIFEEERLPHSHDEISEERKRPDFLFPSAEDYRNLRFPSERLQMLGVKTTCKDRWRQIINEANRIDRKYLLTLQEGISHHQFAEMTAEGVSLVVPRSLHSAYPEAVRVELLSLEDFIRVTMAKCTA